jgi:hypothetical protein
MNERIQIFGAWLFSSLGFALAGLSIVAVPGDAFGAYGGECSYCQGFSPPDTCATSCCSTFSGSDRGLCCNNACNGDPTCAATCCNGDEYCLTQIKVCPNQNSCAMGCSANSRGDGCNPGCSTDGKIGCKDCTCIVTKKDVSGSVTECGCR